MSHSERLQGGWKSGQAIEYLFRKSKALSQTPVLERRERERHTHTYTHTHTHRERERERETKRLNSELHVLT
jgi:hypothetical protein